MGQLHVAKASLGPSPTQLHVATGLLSGTPSGTTQLHVAASVITGTMAPPTQLHVAKASLGGVPVLPANAGGNIGDIEPFSVVTLDGSGSSATTWAWTLVSATNGATVSISNSSSEVASYVAPAKLTGTVLVFRLTVDGGQYAQATHTVLPHGSWVYNGSAWIPRYPG